MIKATKKLRERQPGEVYAVPLSSAAACLVQLVFLSEEGGYLSPTYVGFSGVFAPDDVPDLGTGDLSEPSCAFTSAGDELKDASWKLLGVRPIAYGGLGIMQPEFQGWGWWRGVELGYPSLFLSALHGVGPSYKLFEADRRKLTLGQPAQHSPHDRHATIESVGHARALVEASPDAVRDVVHYILYDGEHVPADLAVLGEASLDDGLLELKQRLAARELPDAELTVRAAAERCGAEYDGWEYPLVVPARGE